MLLISIKNGMTLLPRWLLLLALATAVQQVHANTEQIIFRTKVPVKYSDVARYDGTHKGLSRDGSETTNVKITTPLWPGVIHTEYMPSSGDSYSISCQLGAETDLLSHSITSPSSAWPDRSIISKRKPSLKWLAFVDFVVRWGLNATPLDGARRLLDWTLIGGGKMQDWKEGWWTARISWPATVSCLERQP